MSKQCCVIIGASHAGVSVALQLRKEGWEGAIKLIGAESELPYHRPPLSKDLLSGEKTMDAIRLRPQKIFDDNAIELVLGTTVLDVDPDAQTVQPSNGERLEYDKLVFCTGANVKTLPIGQGLERLFYIRTAADVSQLQAVLPTAKSAVIIGGGYIGLEAAAVLRKLGLQVTVLEMADRVLARVTCKLMSDYMTSLHMLHGVEIRTRTHVTSLHETVDEHGNKGVSIACNDGFELQVDLVVVGVGVAPSTALAEAASLEVSDGVVVDSQGRTSRDNIYAAGDCCSHPSLLYDRMIRLESVQNANDQARVVAANICGKQTDYKAAPWFWSDQYDVKLQMVGISEGYEKVVVRGDATNHEDGFALFYFKDGVLIAADCVKRPKEFMASKQLVMNRSTIGPERLQDQTVEPSKWLQGS